MIKLEPPMAVVAWRELVQAWKRYKARKKHGQGQQKGRLHRGSSQQ